MSESLPFAARLWQTALGSDRRERAPGQASRHRAIGADSTCFPRVAVIPAKNRPIIATASGPDSQESIPVRMAQRPQRSLGTTRLD
jgi:hypothetical protein